MGQAERRTAKSLPPYATWIESLDHFTVELPTESSSWGVPAPPTLT